MKAIFRVAGVDYVQWKAVSRTLLRADFRPPMARGGESYSVRTIGGLLMMAAVFGAFGLAAALLIVLNEDVRFTGTVTLTYVAFVVVTSVLSQHAATMFSPADYRILGPRPVSRQTFFAIRLTNVLFHALLLTTLMAHPPIVAFLLAHGVSAVRALAGAIALYAWAFTLTLALVAAYGALLRWAGAERLQRAIGYMQLALGLLVYGGFFVLLQTFGGRAVVSATLPDSPWLVLAPPAWYVSYLEIATGIATGWSWVRAVLSILAPAALLAVLRGRLGLEFAERLAEAREPVAVSPPSGAPLLFRRNEALAVSRLVLAQFRYDLRVRMGVLAIVPLVLLYLALGATGDAADPFVAPAGRLETDYMAFALLIFPALLTQQFGTSEAFRASWIYHVTVADPARLVVALKNVAAVYFLVPLTLLLVALFAWRFGHAGHAAVHAGVLGLISHVALQAALIVRPRLPFAMPPEKGLGSVALFAWMVAVLLGGQALLFVLQRWVYVSGLRVAAAAAVLVALTWVLERVLKWRAASARTRPV